MNNGTVLTANDYNSSADHAIGATLTVISAIGTLLNTTSFVYFKTMKSKNNNSRFFKRIYMVITFNDSIICFFLFPVIQAAFSPNRGRSIYGVKDLSLLFFNKIFCGFWIILWWTITQLSVLMVGILSISRLVILKYPQKQLKTWPAFVVPVGFCVCFVSIWTVFIASGNTHVVYIQQLMACLLHAVPTTDLGATVTRAHLEAGVAAHAIYTVVPTVLFVVIVTSFVLSLVLLRKSDKKSAAVGSKGHSHRDATKTVVLVTLLYIVCNIPFVIFVWLFLATSAKGTTLHKEDISVLEYWIEWNKQDSFRQHYMYILIQQVSVSLNSILNPLIYLTRMRQFRGRVRKMLTSGGSEGVSGGQEGGTGTVYQNTRPIVHTTSA